MFSPGSTLVDHPAPVDHGDGGHRPRRTNHQYRHLSGQTCKSQKHEWNARSPPALVGGIVAACKEVVRRVSLPVPALVPKGCDAHRLQRVRFGNRSKKFRLTSLILQICLVKLNSRLPFFSHPLPYLMIPSVWINHDRVLPSLLNA